MKKPMDVKKQRIIAVLCMLAANTLLFLTLRLLNSYDEVSVGQFLYHAQTSGEGAGSSVAWTNIMHALGGGLALTLAGCGGYVLLSGKAGKWLHTSWYEEYRAGRVCRFFRWHMLGLAAALLAFSGFFFLERTNVLAYMGALATESDFIEDHYADPDATRLTFPEEKRNLIYIYLESMENTFSDPAAGEPITADYIPELTALARENISFSHTYGMGGPLSYEGTTWTAAALVAQTAGVPIKTPLFEDGFGEENQYMPGVTSLGDVLNSAGYRQVFLLGSNAEFADKEIYFIGHGNYEIIDLEALKDDGELPDDYKVWWGCEDEKLFAFAKETLTELGQGEEPFNFTMLTVDTHFPDGYVCRLCDEEYEEQYANVLACSSRQVGAFVQWITEQPFYENTTIVLSGDHLTMDPNFLDGLDGDYIRTTYNCFINAAAQPVRETNRQFGSFDLFPTTLAALGVEVEGDRLGLGTNLFSHYATLTEQYGWEYVDSELQKPSDFYDETILMLDE